MVTVCVRLTRSVETANDALVAPAGTVTAAGTDTTDELLLETVTTALPEGAGPERVTVPAAAALPPTTLTGASVNPVSVGTGLGAGGVASMRNRTPSPNAPPTIVEPY